MLLSFISFCPISVYERRLAVQNDLNLRSLPWHRTQDELAAHLVNPFLHTGQPETFVFGMQVKSTTVIHQAELNLFRAKGQRRSEIPGLCVFDRIRQRLLGDSQ